MPFSNLGNCIGVYFSKEGIFIKDLGNADVEFSPQAKMKTSTNDHKFPKVIPRNSIVNLCH